MQVGRLAAASLVLALSAGACSLVEQISTEAPREAQWAVDPTFVVAEDTIEIPLLVGEIECASGRDATGRIEVDVDYTDDAVVITAYVRPLDGDQACPSNPPTPHTLVLDEPVGERELRNGASDEIALRPLELPDGVGVADPGSVIAGDDTIPREVFLLVEALHVRALNLEELEDVGDLSLHPGGVDLLLGENVERTAGPDDLRTADGWMLDEELYAGSVGPFSALELLGQVEQVEVSMGPQPHCASPSRPTPAGYTDFVRVAVEPAAIGSCVEWFVVNLYLDADGLMRAIQLDLWEP